MMPRFRNRGSAIRPVHRLKHVVDLSATLAKNTNIAQALIHSVDAPVLASTEEVETGSKVNGIYLKVIVASNEAQVTGAIPNVYMYVMKNQGGFVPAPTPNNVGSSDSKRFIIHQEMVMIDNKVSGQPSVMFNGVIVIPKGYRRMGPDDLLQVFIFSPAINITFCIQAHYKEFR